MGNPSETDPMEFWLWRYDEHGRVKSPVHNRLVFRESVGYCDALEVILFLMIAQSMLGEYNP